MSAAGLVSGFVDSLNKRSPAQQPFLFVLSPQILRGQNAVKSVRTGTLSTQANYIGNRVLLTANYFPTSMTDKLDRLIPWIHRFTAYQLVSGLLLAE